MKKKKRRQKNEDEAKARLRAEVILKVRSGVLTATEGAELLGVSRRVYYKWENRALAAMADVLEDKPAGRPGPSEDDLQRKQLENEVNDLKKQLESERERQRLKDMAWKLKVELAEKKVKKK